MNTSHDTDEEVRRWVEKAENDFRNAEYVMTLAENCPYDTVSYHCQQCVEKYLEALLIHRNVDFPRTHDLVVLFNLSMKEVSLQFPVEFVQPLNRYATETRYPGVWEPVGENEARQAFEKMSVVRNTIRNVLSSILLAS